MTDKVEALLCEVGQIRTAMERVYTAVYTSFGIVLPGILAVVAFLSKDFTLGGTVPSLIPFLFITVLSLGAMWSQNLWMELLRYVRYYYAVLLPRLYEATNQEEEHHFLQYEHTRSWGSWAPITLFNFSCVLLMLFADVTCFLVDDTFGRFLGAVGAFLILAGATSTLLVMKEARDTEKILRDPAAYRARTGDYLPGVRTASGGETPQGLRTAETMPRPAHPSSRAPRART